MSMETINDRCPSCGVAYIDHLGLIGTCRKLQEAVAELHRYRVGDLMAERDRYREALNNIRTQIAAGTPSNLVWRLADNALRGGEE